MTSELSRDVSRLLIWAGVVLLVLALAVNPSTLQWFEPEQSLSDRALAEGLESRLWFLAVSALLIGAGFASRRVDLIRSRTVARIVIACAFLCLPVLVAERLLAPFMEHSSTIFVRDAVLGWKHEPGAEDYWHGVAFRINSKGLRGPEREYEKEPGVGRILFLGDSVTFGFRNPDEAKVFPAQVERLMSEGRELPVECINGGVDGYSPWQEHLFLETEGLRYQPDLVVFSFVLNDVTEKMSLSRFGGEGEGYQVEHSVIGDGLDWIQRTNIGRYASFLGERLRSADGQEGEDLRPGELSAYELLLNPNSEAVRRAWRLTLQNIEKIVETCRENHIPLLVVVFPYTIQVARPEFDTPQRALAQFCEAQQVPYLDLQGPIVRELGRLEMTDEHFFMDAIHPTNAGYLFCAEETVAAIRARGWFAEDHE